MGGKASKPAVESSAAAVPPTPPPAPNDKPVTHYDKMRYVPIFDQLDEHKTGYISEDEVVDAFKKLHLPEKYAKKFMEEADIDHDGKITKEEFILYAKHKEESIYTAFAKMDKDGNGTLDKEEIGELLESLHLHPSESDKEKILHVFTKNEKISYAEFRDVFILLDPADLGELTDEMQELFDWAHDEHGGAIHAETASTKKGPDPIVSALCGGLGACISRTCVSPLERLRLTLIADGAKYGGSMGAAFSGILNEEGILGFWRGNGLNMIRILPQNCVAFFAKDYFKQEFSNLPISKGLQTVGASCSSGITCILAVYPLDLVRGRMTTSPQWATGIYDGLTKVVNKEGFFALYNGWFPSAVWAIPYYGALFYTNDTLKKKYVDTFGEEDLKNKKWMSAVFGAAGGATSTFVAFPLESIRRKLQVQGVGGRPVLYSGVFDGLATVAAKEGIGGLYVGCFANVLKMVPAQAITFGTMPYIKQAFGI